VKVVGRNFGVMVGKNNINLGKVVVDKGFGRLECIESMSFGVELWWMKILGLSIIVMVRRWGLSCAMISISIILVSPIRLRIIISSLECIPIHGKFLIEW